VTYEVVTERHKTERHKTPARVAHKARHDSLTDLPNRVLLGEQKSEGLNEVATASGAMAMLCLDLDNFKTVNNRLGHAAGDWPLRWVAAAEGAGRRARHRSREGGDEFALIQRDYRPNRPSG